MYFTTELISEISFRIGDFELAVPSDKVCLNNRRQPVLCVVFCQVRI